MNINTKEYWEKRFATGDWEAKKGSEQTTIFARTFIQYIGVEPEFSGRILDFGCAFGDAFPVYREHFKRASLIGVDIAEAAIARCRERYGDIAEFIQCDYRCVPEADVIISSNVLEHLSRQMEVVRHLLTKCRDLYIVVPYKEMLSPGGEHVNSYDASCFSELGTVEHTVFLSEGWSDYGLHLWFHIYLKNLVRPFFKRKPLRRKKMIMFHLQGKLSEASVPRILIQ